MKNKLTLEDLLLISIYSVFIKKKKCSYGTLVLEAFKKFPGDFSLDEYNFYPDSLKMDRPLRELREKGLISGSPITFYTLTNLGKTKAQKLLHHSEENKGRYSKIKKSPALRIFEDIEKSKDFKDYIQNTNYQVNEMKIRGLLGFTLETPKGNITNQLKYLLTLVPSNKNNIRDYLNNYLKYLLGKYG